jgi:hypothetical protein
MLVSGRSVVDQSDLKFDWYDAWILAAIVWATEGDAPVPLWDVIGTADALNKAIVTRSELECGIGRLVSAGLICVASDGFKAMPRALALKAPGPPVEIVSQAIGAQEWSPNSEMPQTQRDMYVTVDAYKKALKKYHKEFSKRYRTKKTDA